MSGVPASVGLAARLLERADGGISTLRPRVTQTFAAEQARAAPMIERTEEVAAPPPASSPRRDAPIADPPAAAAAVGPPPAQRLMPPPIPAAPQVAAQADPAAIAPHAGAPAAPAVTADPVAPPPAGAAPGPVPAPSRGAPPAPQRPRQTDSLSAAVMQLLAPDPAASSATLEVAPIPSRRDAPIGNDRRALPAGSAPMPEPARPASEPGLTIHIGEIVVAPEPRPAVREAPRSAWQPPLSLADYRATRARERR